MYYPNKLNNNGKKWPNMVWSINCQKDPVIPLLLMSIEVLKSISLKLKSLDFINIYIIYHLTPHEAFWYVISLII